MADRQLIEQLRENVKKAGAVVRRLREENGELKRALGEKEELLKEHGRALQDLQTKYETLKVAKSLSGIVPEGEDARSKINLIIKDLDRCIGLLNR
jgi:predicted RNase H-like nuclease (RuvC/YqgF family)